MHHWEERQRQRLHHNMIEQAKPTIKRYSKSREKGNLSGSRAKGSHQSITTNVNMPFRQVLAIFKLLKYEELLGEYGFPSKIKEKQSVNYIDQMIKKVDDEDQDKFLSLMSALLSITAQQKTVLLRRTPILKRSLNRHYPPTHNSTHIKKCESIGAKKPDKIPTFRIKSKTQLHRPSVIMETASSKLTQKSTIPKRSKAKDDSIIVHQFKLRGKATVKFSNKIAFLQRLQSRLKTINHQDGKDKDAEANLYYKQIKEMYLSYDTATLTSNISNIDIEEIIDCYAIEIEQRIVQLPSRPPLNPEIKRGKSKKSQIQELLKESLVEPTKYLDKEPEHHRTFIRQDLASEMDDAQSIDNSEGSRTSFEQSEDLFDKEIQSIAYDLSCFNYQYGDETMGACSRKDIKNFIQLVMMAGKMEKQAPIISYVYIKRVLNACKKDKISNRNWKNLILVTLIESSKIWDDQSLENHSFSKVIAPYTTLQINRLERHLLNFLNYNLRIDSKEYCESYFNLRKHANEASKTAHLMPLSLQTIKKLQAGTKKCERSLKQAYKKKLNESF